MLANERVTGHKVGLVPTMGALHQGHISLIKRAKAASNFVVCSIFVNPTQFNDPKDLEKYPRTLEADLHKLAEAGCNLVYTPEIDEIYKNEADFEFDFAGLDQPMEGANRPGHFEGVVRVVKRLFEIVKPDVACFGLKDFQQFAIIKQLVRYFDLPIELIGCPIIREPNGLAMSSRNVLLSDDEVTRALSLSRSLNMVKTQFPHKTIEELKDLAIRALKNDVEVEYFEIAEPEFLTPIEDKSEAEHARAFVAARVGKVRLIDNVEIF